MPTKTLLRSLNNVRTLSPTHKGTNFEERSLQMLQSHLSMRLERVGGKSDGGIDLQGWWWLPTIKKQHKGAPRKSYLTKPESRQRFRILAQCKAEQTKVGPKYVREMEGVVLGHQARASKPDFSRDTTDGKSILETTRDNIDVSTSFGSAPVPIVALLISESPFTKAALQHVQSSPVPFFLLQLPPLSEDASHCSNCPPEESINAAFWNPTLAGKHGLFGGEFEIRWELSMKPRSEASPYMDMSNPGRGRLTLWMNNRRVQNWVPPVTS